MDSILLIVSNSPSTPNGMRAFKLANNFRLLGGEVALYLLQDAVLSALVNLESEAKTTIEATINSGIVCYCSEDDLSLRGFRRKDILSKVQLSSYSELVELMMEKYNKVIGIF